MAKSRDVTAPVAIALGSNLGDRRGHLEWALDRLRERVAELRRSAFIETDAEDVPCPQPAYLNAAVIGVTALPPKELLRWLLELEAERGRVRDGVRSARTLDLDLILYGDLVVSEADLTPTASALSRATLRPRATGRAGARLDRSRHRPDDPPAPRALVVIDTLRSTQST